MPWDPHAKDEKAPVLLVQCSAEFLSQMYLREVETGAKKPHSAWHDRPYQAGKWTQQLPELRINKKTSHQYEPKKGKRLCRANLGASNHSEHLWAQTSGTAPADIQVWVTQQTYSSPGHGKCRNSIQSAAAVLHLSFSPLYFPVLSTFVFLASLERTISIVYSQTRCWVVQP